MAAKKKTAKGYEFLVAELKKHKNAVYADLAAKAEKKGFTVYPVMFGRAKASLGLVATKKRRKKKASKRGPGRPRKVGRRGPGRPRKSSDGPLAAVQDLVSTMREQERDNAALRATLGKIRDLIDRAL